jgi:hypothetical protein
MRIPIYDLIKVGSFEFPRTNTAKSHPICQPHEILLNLKVLFTVAFFALFFLYSPSVKSAGPTNVSGTIFSDTTWRLSNSPYNVVGNVGVATGATLTIEPGVTIQFTGAYQILIKGNLIANGTSSAPIIFTSSTPGVSSGATMLKFEGANLSNSQLSYLQMSYAARAIMVGSGGGEFNPGQPCIGTLTASQVAINNAEVRTGGYDAASKLVLDNATISSSTIIGQYPRSEPIEIRNSSISSSTIHSDSYNYGITLSSSTVNSTQFRLGCCGANFNLNNSTIQDSSISEGGGSPVVGPVAISNSKLIRTPINLPASNFTISNSLFRFNSTPGMRFGNGAISYSSFMGDGTGVGMELTGYYGYGIGGSITISNTTFAQNLVGLKLTGANAASFMNNNFIHNTIYNLENRRSGPITATGNYWGTNDANQISARIYDYYDDIDLGAVNSSGYLPTPSTAAPVSPPMNVQATLSGSNVVVSWSANPESDTAGYKVHYGSTSSYPYQNVVDVGNVINYALSGLSSTVHYIAVTAYDVDADGIDDWTDGNESWFSSEVTADLTPPTVQFSQSTFSANENTAQATIAVTLSKQYGSTVTVAYATSDGTAAAGSDYTSNSGTLAFAPGETSKTFAVPILDDSLDEDNEIFNVALSNPSNATLGAPSSATVTILDNDTPPAVQFSVGAYSVDESAGTVAITITLSAASGRQLTVNYATSDGTAAAGSDYTSNSGTLAFAPGETSKTFGISVIDNLEDAENKTVNMTLSSPSNATLGARSDATLIVEDDDAPPVMINVPDDPSQPVDVSITLSTGTAQLTLENISAGGLVAVTVSKIPPSSTPNTFSLLGIYYDLSAPSVNFGRATIRLPYRDSDVTAAGISEQSLRLLHFENGVWKDITTSLDTNANIIAGIVESFSPFVLGVQNMQNCAVSINNGAAFTGHLDVTIFSNMPGAAEQMVSNDAGFTGAQWQPYNSAVTWSVTDPGNRIVTLLVYARLRDTNGSLLCSGLTMNDDIIYDPLAPSINAVIVQPSQETALRMPASGGITLQISAADQQGGSGVADMQIGMDTNFTGARWQPLSATVQVTAQPSDKLYVRVRDAAGNRSDTVSVNVSGQHSIFLPTVVR